jgi:hypothetical protein
MRKALFAGAALLVLVVPIALGGPVNPVGGERGYLNLQLEPFSVRNFSETFKGKERASVIAIGRGDTPLGLYVYDPDGNCVAWDDLSLSTQNISDDMVVDWYPPRQGKYEIELRNFGRRGNRVEVVIR